MKKNYCTWSPDGDWGECCNYHDIAYSLIWDARLEADRKLKKDMEKAGHPRLAKVYYFFVRLFGRFRV